MCYLVLVLALQLAHLAVHQVLDGVDLGLHLLLGGLQLVLQFGDERFAAAAVQRSLQHKSVKWCSSTFAVLSFLVACFNIWKRSVRKIVYNVFF